MPARVASWFLGFWLFIFSCGWGEALLIAAQTVPASGSPTGSPVASSPPAKLGDLKTVAESTQYRATATGAEAELYLKRLARLWPESSLESIGQTMEGRDIWALVTPAPQGQPVITLLLLGGIHSGECDGKEALLALARDYAERAQADNQRLEILKNVRIIFVPNFNADGNERRGLNNRPGQAGPTEGVGVRENAQALDLNRDFVKLESPEVRSLVAALNRWNVDVLVDAHTTNGSLHRYDLTYSVPSHPNTPAAISNLLHEKILPKVTENLEQAGIATFYYGNFEDQHRQWKSFGHEPRYSIELMGMRGRIGILAESYSYATYQRRIEASYAFIDQIINQLNERAPEIRAAIDQAASANRSGDSLTLKAELAQTAPAVKVRGYQTADRSQPRPPYNSESAAKHQPHDYEVGLWVTASPTEVTRMPNAYAIMPDATWALSRLQMQGVTIERLNQDLNNIGGERYLIERVESGPKLQNHTLRSVTATTQAERLKLAQGTYIVRSAQPLGKLAAYLLEPGSEDGLAAWNFFHPELKPGSTYPVERVLDDLPSAALETVTQLPPGERLTLQRVLKPGQIVEYSTTSPSGASWMAGSNELVVQRDTQWISIDPATGAGQVNPTIRQMITAFGELPEFKGDPAGLRQLGPDTLKVSQRFGLHQHQRDLYFYDAQLNIAKRLTHSPQQEEQLAELSPTGEHVAYVRDNDLYLIDCRSGTERRLTSDGSVERLNGILDWVYQEEIYGRGQFRAFWFSPNGRRLAFLQLDQTPVMRYAVSDSIHYRQELEETRYPKAGDPLPIARMWVANIDEGQLQQIDLSEYPTEDRLVVRVTWSPDNELWLQIQNRIQTEQSVLHVDLSSGRGQRVLHEQSPGWIEVLGQPKFLPGGDFLWLSDLPDGRRHLYRFQRASGKLKPLTQGDWDIADLEGVTPDGATAYVSGNISHPTERQLLSVDTLSGVTRQVTTQPGSHRVRLSEDARYMLDTWSNLQSPPRTELRSLDGQVVRTLGAPVSDRYQYALLAQPQLTTIKARDGLEMPALIMLPPDWSADKPDRLPVVFHVYAGPQAPTVNNAWGGRDYWWHQTLCSQGFAVVLCDNRSSRGRGIADTWKIHRDLGRVELQDIEDAVDWINGQPWSDPARIGIWGWSYGGYMTAYALTHSQKFAAGISGAPVTDWRNYDAIYTERYMDLPQKNEAGYKSSSAVEAAENLHGRLLIIHGERDDNVHMSNTLQLAYALQKAGKPFEMMIYPKNRHGVVDPEQRYHMYSMMTDFLKRSLQAPHGSLGFLEQENYRTGK